MPGVRSSTDASVNKPAALQKWFSDIASKPFDQSYSMIPRPVPFPRPKGHPFISTVHLAVEIPLDCFLHKCNGFEKHKATSGSKPTSHLMLNFCTPMSRVVFTETPDRADLASLQGRAKQLRYQMFNSRRPVSVLDRLSIWSKIHYIVPNC
jgi:hypothetical protein